MRWVSPRLYHCVCPVPWGDQGWGDLPWLSHHWSQGSWTIPEPHMYLGSTPRRDRAGAPPPLPTLAPSPIGTWSPNRKGL